ncbi:unnamed protein product [Ceutorhynchus assimilis]|uniref:C2H2-type domain-containing protein n=1 Tax=Ceutorhynchus assimilis TaxID=467358 RepID=A0A9N9MH80_9CUCU|nr:unnamed protein product [Ceutorhynchus assimilis]
MDETQTQVNKQVDNSIEYFKKICRVCLVPSENLCPIINVVFNHKNIEKEVSCTLTEVFNKYCDVVKDAYLKPQNICELCLDLTSKAFSAFELFNASNARLDNIIAQTKLNEHNSVIEIDLLSEASDGNQEFDPTGSNIEIDDEDDDVRSETGDDDDDDEIDGTGSRHINRSLDKSTLSEKQKTMFEATKKEILSRIQREAQIFRCNLCDSGLLTGIEVVIEHMKDEHPLEKQCILCLKTFPTQSCALSHVNSFHSNKNENLPLCRKCNKFFKNQEALDEHMESEEHKNYNFQCICHFCKKIFNRGILLKRHILEVHFKKHNKSGTCPKCGVAFKHKENLNSHVCAYEHIENAKAACLLCSKCGHDFPSEHLLKLHQKNQHSRPLKCDYCSEMFQAPSAYFKHRISHPECTDIVCPLCCQVSENLAEYKMHRLENHTEHVCHICNKGFHKECTMTQHLRTHSSNQLFECHLCPQKFKYKSSLTLHINEHINRPSYACNYCDKTFKRQRLLRIHKTVVHKNVKKFKCRKCDKAFTNNWALHSHLRLHMGFKPFSCPFCTMVFVDTTNRHRHVKKIHPDKMDDFESYKQTYQSEEVRIVNSIPITSIDRSSGDEEDTNDLEDEDDTEMITIEEEEEEEEEIIHIKNEDMESDVQENDLSDN